MSDNFMKLTFKGKEASACCPAPVVRDALGYIEAPWADGVVKSPVGEIPRVHTELKESDKWGALKVRLGIGRMNYSVKPGLYAVGSPTPESPVLLSANYKLSFDRLRSCLGGLDLWIMVLDTKGINVWCAAGKGTFGTMELIRRIASTGIREIVSHRVVIAPQLGAPGISAHEVRKQSGFRVVYGPVRVSDINAFLEAGNKASQEMRSVEFPISERMVLIPMEFIPAAKLMVPAAVALFVLSGLGPEGYSLDAVKNTGLVNAAMVLSGYIGGTVLSPALLPWLPGKAFSVKGALVGLVMAFAGAYYSLSEGVLTGGAALAAWFLIVPAVSSFGAMNFTGASTYTSLSGVKAEMKVAVPLQILGAVAGLGLWLTGLFI